MIYASFPSAAASLREAGYELLCLSHQREAFMTDLRDIAIPDPRIRPEADGAREVLATVAALPVGDLPVGLSVEETYERLDTQKADRAIRRGAPGFISVMDGVWVGRRLADDIRAVVSSLRALPILEPEHPVVQERAEMIAKEVGVGDQDPLDFAFRSLSVKHRAINETFGLWDATSA